MTPIIVQCVSQDSQCQNCYHAKPHQKGPFCPLSKPKDTDPLIHCPRHFLHAFCAPVNTVAITEEKILK